MTDEINVRFRHHTGFGEFWTLFLTGFLTGGDIGPFPVAGTSSIQQLKDKLQAEWPKEGALVNEAPHSPADIKLILGGKFLDSTEVLNDLRPALGDPQPDAIVTMHVIVRPQSTLKSSAKQADEDKKKGCRFCCIQ